MSRHRDEGLGDAERSRRDSPDDRIQEAIARLERAARDVSATASDSAAEYLEGVAKRFTRRPEPRTAYGDRSSEPSWPWSGRPRTARLCRDRERGRILGVCAGIANYYGIETWVARCIALTGLIFLTSPTLVVYFIAAIVMGKDLGHKRLGRRYRRHGGEDVDRGEPTWIPGQRLRDVRADFDQVELRLRRMEAHVTSGHYELQRELAKIAKT